MPFVDGDSGPSWAACGQQHKTPTSKQQQTLLQQMLNSSQLLVHVMEQQHPLLVATKHDNAHAPDVPESAGTLFWQQKDTSLDQIRTFGHKTKLGLHTIDCGNNDDNEEEDGKTLLTLDCQALEEEEEELIRMANTVGMRDPEVGVSSSVTSLK